MHLYWYKVSRAYGTNGRGKLEKRGKFENTEFEERTILKWAL